MTYLPLVQIIDPEKWTSGTEHKFADIKNRFNLINRRFVIDLNTILHDRIMDRR